MSAARPTPLSTLLSQALVAFTIEVDGEFEHQMPHRTTWGPAAGSSAGPWHVSLVMWANFMQYVDIGGVPLRDLDPYVRMTNLAGMERWGYITVEPDPAGRRAKSPRPDWLVRPTRAGCQAQQVWRPLPDLIESRWRDRYAAAEVGKLAETLQALIIQLDAGLPRYLPVVKNELFTELPQLPPVEWPALPDLSVLFSQLLLAITVEFESDSDLSLPICANLLRALETTPQRIRDLPRLTGVSKESIAMSCGVLEKGGYTVVEPDRAAGRGKVARLTTKGLAAQAGYRDRLDRLEAAWPHRFGHGPLRDLRRGLERLVGSPASASPLLRNLATYDDGWRAFVPRPDTLPHHPMVLHRGGFPDGS